MRKRIFRRRFLWGLLLTALVVGGFAALCVYRWSAWFYEPAERSYVVNDFSDVYITAGENAESERTISWRMNDADMCVFILRRENSDLCHKNSDLSHDNSVADTFYIKGDVNASEGGKAHLFKVKLDSLEAGEYDCILKKDIKDSVEGACSVDEYAFYFCVEKGVDSLQFLAFGDMLIEEGDAEIADCISVLLQKQDDGLDAIISTGNMAKTRAEQDYEAVAKVLSSAVRVPLLTVPGDRDYDKGLVRKLDARWMHRFAYPMNGPKRFAGRTYYVDYALCRMIFIDTQALQSVSDFTVLQTWLDKVLMQTEDKWKIVVMHHPVHAAAAGADNVILYAALHKTLDRADLVVAGHDMTYARRADISLSDLINAEHTVPVYLLTTAAKEAWLPKCSPLDQRIGSCRAFYEKIAVSKEAIEVKTCYLAYPDSVYDAFRIDANKRVTPTLLLPEEVIEAPADSWNMTPLRRRRFEHIRSARIEKSKK